MPRHGRNGRPPAARGYVLGLLALFGFVMDADAGLTTRVEPGTGLQGWSWEADGVRLDLNQLLPDQVRAFYQGRGFSAAESERLAATCVFQAILRRAADASVPLEVELADWRVKQAGRAPVPPRTSQAWLAGWGTPSLAEPQRIALRWALFPSAQRFAPGDWNMGMLTLDVPHGERFDLELRWHHGSREEVVTLRELRCAGDRP